MTLKHMSLFSGFGGIDLALKDVLKAETVCVCVCDYEKGPSKILAHRFPRIPNLRDVTKVNWHDWVDKVDIISGGSPCQDLSAAGAKQGMTEGTRSNLWVNMREAISIIRPQLVVWENVRGAYSTKASSSMEHCSRCVGAPAPNTRRKFRDGQPSLRALGRVLGDLSSLRYDTFWYGLRASDVGAAHHRFRVFVFAVPSDSNGQGLERYTDSQRTSPSERYGYSEQSTNSSDSKVNYLPTPIVTDSHPTSPGDLNRHSPALRAVAPMFLPTLRISNNENRQSEQYAGNRGNYYGLLRGLVDWADYEPAIRNQERVFGRLAPAPASLNLRTGKNQLSAKFSEWLMGLPEGWVTDVPNLSRKEQLQALGNGVVPAQCTAATRRFLLDYSKFSVLDS